MIGSKDLYEKFAEILYSIAPENSSKTAMTATDLSDSGDACTFKFDYYNEKNECKWFLPGSSKITGDFRELLFSLRNSYIEEHQPSWNGCVFTLDIETGKFEVELKYAD